MIRRRQRPDGLPFRVYERRGVRDYSIGYKAADGKWAFRLKCKIEDRTKIAELRREAVSRANKLNDGSPAEDTFTALADAWLAFQEALPLDAKKRRADSTIAENKRELKNLKAAFGDLRVQDMVKADANAYLDACWQAVDAHGNPRPRPEKGNKEISLARTILAYAVRLGKIETNPFLGFERNERDTEQRYVDHHELALAVEVGRMMGGPQHIVALALKTAYLCVRRSVEVRALTRDQFGEKGISWTSGKRQKGQGKKVVLIEWSDELRATVDEALAVKRNKLAGTWHVFGNLSGQKYTKGGWKKTLSVLMDECVRVAAERRIAFQPFSLQDCRPKGVSDKLESGHEDVIDATLHTSERMVRQVYDRRRTRVAKPVK